MTPRVRLPILIRRIVLVLVVVLEVNARGSGIEDDAKRHRVEAQHPKSDW